MDFLRQLEVFEPEKFNTPVHVIGAGAIGSWLTLFLAKLGVKNITVYDFDTVIEHNLPNQFFDLSDVGMEKTKALSVNTELFTDAEVKYKNKEVTGNERLTGIVFLAVDSMKARKEIFNKACRLNPRVKLVIEVRMDLEGGRVYTVEPTNLRQVEQYLETFYTDEEASVSACGASQSVVATATQLSSIAAWQLIKWHNKDDDIQNEILVDSRRMYFMNRTFE